MALVVGDNTYLNEADADLYFASRYNSSAWTALDSPTKEILLQSATRALDLYCDWAGYKSDPSQLLEFPRNDNDVPEHVKIAECEIALSILESGSVVSEREPNLKELKADVITFKFGDISSSNTIYNDFTSDLLSRYCSASSGSGGKRLTRV